MHSTRGPCSGPTAPPAGVMDLTLCGAQLSVCRRTGSAAPGKHFSRSVSVCVASEGPGKRNTLSDVGFGVSRSSKNLRRSNSTTQVNQQANGSHELSDGCLTVLDVGSDGRRKLTSLSKTSPDGTTWNILDDQPRMFPLHSGSRSTGSVDSSSSLRKRETGIALAATFTANNRSNKGAVGNSVTTILHNNYSEKPLTPKSSNQKPSFNNILKATANDEASPEIGSLTKSQKNFSSPSNNRSALGPVSPRGREVSEEKAERFIQQVNHAAVTIQRWYRRHAGRRHSDRASLRRVLASKRKEWEELRAEEGGDEQPHRKEQDRKKVREEKARLARLAAIQELQQNRAQQAAEVQLDSLRPPGALGRKKPPRVAPSPPSNNSPLPPADTKAKNTDCNVNAALDLPEWSFRAVSPAASNHRGSQCSQEDAAERDFPNRKPLRKDKSRHARLSDATSTTSTPQLAVPTEGVAARQEPQQRRAQRPPELQHAAAAGARKKPLRIPQSDRVPTSPSNNVPTSPPDTKSKNADSNLNVTDDIVELGFTAASPAPSNHGGSQEVLQRLLSAEEPQRGAAGSRAASKSTLNELLDTLKLLEEEPERLEEPVSRRRRHHDKYAWIDQDGDSNSLTTDNLELHGQLSRQPALPDGGALLSEAKLQSIMSFLDEMEQSEQERPRSVTSGSHREAVMSEEELAGAELAAAEVSDSMMRIKMELEEKKRTVLLLQSALAQQRELTARHVKDTEKELNRSFRLQKEQYEATIQRHLSFIDQLIGDKKALSERCETVLCELQQVDHKSTKKISHMQQQHHMEIKKLKDLMSASEKIRREKWIDGKTKKIKEMTVKGLEPEIQKLISKHKQELKKLKTLHEAELLQADQRAAQRYVQQTQDLRQQLEREAGYQCQRERELAKQRYEKQLQEEEESLQLQRKRLYQEVAEEKERLALMAARQRSELDELRRQMEENSCVAGRTIREELERRHQMELSSLQERLDLEKQSWEENQKKKEEAWLLSRERELKDVLRQERDKEIELAIWRLEEETTREKEECERAADSRLKRVREKYEAELGELERSERSAVEKHQEVRRQLVQTEGELIRLQGALRLKDQQLQDVTLARDKMADERRGLAEVIRQEFAERLVETDEENRRLKVEVSELRARLRLEVERVTREKEQELEEVHLRVKSAIIKKEEMVSALRKQHEAAVKRADHLEALWEQQRKQLLEK